MIEENGVLYPLEIKEHADPSVCGLKAFDLLDKIPGEKRGPVGVICLYGEPVTLRGEDRVIPVGYLRRRRFRSNFLLHFFTKRRIIC